MSSFLFEQVPHLPRHGGNTILQKNQRGKIVSKHSFLKTQPFSLPLSGHDSFHSAGTKNVHPPTDGWTAEAEKPASPPFRTREAPSFPKEPFGPLP
jgi:hypothetical protein